jgi:hypothetical protein
MDKIYAAARAIAVILAIASAFVSIPYLALSLLVLGGIAAIGNDPEKNARIYLVAIVLRVGARALDVIPVVGSHLVTIFQGIGAAYIGASLVAITITLACRIKSDWMK